MNIRLNYSHGESLALASVFSDRLAIIDLPPEIWDDEGEQKPLNVRGDGARPAPPRREASHQSWELTYTLRVPSSLYVALFPDREEQRRYIGR